MDWLNELQNQVLNQFRRPSVSYETKQYANQRLTEKRGLFERVTRANAYEDFLLTELQAEREKFKLYKDRDGDDGDELLEDSPYDEFRTQPVCTCNGKRAHRCPLKRGVLPREVRTAGSIDDGIREFRASHPGNPLVLQDAQDEWAALVGEVEQHFRDLLAILASDEIPENADWPQGAETTEQPAD